MNEVERRDHRIRLIMEGRTNMEVIDLDDGTHERAWYVDGVPAAGLDLAALSETTTEDAAAALGLVNLDREMIADDVAVIRQRISANLRIVSQRLEDMLQDTLAEYPDG